MAEAKRDTQEANCNGPLQWAGRRALTTPNSAKERSEHQKNVIIFDLVIARVISVICVSCFFSAFLLFFGRQQKAP